MGRPLAPDSIDTLNLPYQRDSERYFKCLRELGWAIWLDSGQPATRGGRYDILCAAPVKQLLQDEDGCRCVDLEGATPRLRHYDDPWQALAAELPPVRPADTLPELPFCGGALGYFSYDLGRDIEQLQPRIADDIGLPSMLVGIYDWALIQDHHLRRTTLVYRAGTDCTALQQRLQSLSPLEPAAPFIVEALQSNTDRQQYLSRVERIQRYIRNGDCYQVNFAQRYSARYQGDLLSAYRALRERLGSPFSGFMETDYGTVLSLSPERFVQVRQGQVLAQPIKGTAARGSTPEEDRQQAEQLRRSEKDRAENLMIVDLLRNDLSKACRHHSVKATRLFELETFANVHHLVSSITGQLKAGCNALTLLKDCFPGGSITGAPKIRAMEVIEELENSRRSVYCGSLGYIDIGGNMDTNIAIRTLVANAESLYVWGGGGIVADSEPDSEYRESLTKIGAILEVLGHFQTEDSEQPSRRP